MTVDFGYGRSPALRIASIAWKGSWSETKIRAQFERVEKWAKSRGLRTGRWIFREPGPRRWEVAIEVRGKARGTGPIRTKTLRASTVARVVFDPDAVSPRVIYHGLADWLRWQRREKQVRTVLSSREVYAGNPWKEPKVWARTEIQFVVRK